ncbi:MAG: hypothetical protein VCC99_13125 [Alphaproteobacteria bacterium]
MALDLVNQTPELTGFAEEQLVSFLQSLEANPLGWQAVHFHFSKLSPSHRRESTVRIALAGLQDLVRLHDGRTSVLFNYDIVLLVRGPLVTVVNDAIDSTRALFRDDPLSKRPEAFSTWYDLSIGNNRLQTSIRKLVVEKARAQNAQTTKGGDFVEIEPLDPDRLFKLQQALTGLDLSAYVRRQPVCAVLHDRPPQPVFDEIYVHIADLQKPLMPNVNLAGNRWLFQHLTQSLDLRVLALLTRNPGKMMPGPISLNMNIDTVLSQSFVKFDETLRDGQQRQIVIEIQPVDVFVDIKAFQFGRDFLRSKGYRLCLDGLRPESLVLLDRELLGVDLIKLFWANTVPAAANGGVRGFTEAVMQAGPERLIIAHCDDASAIDFGRTHGLKLFQGRYLDQLLNPGVAIRN